MTVYPNSNLSQISSPSHAVFQYVEKKFDEWFEHNTQPGAPMGKDIQGMYYGEADQPAIYSKKGAIQQAIENAIDQANEDNKPVLLSSFGIECAFE
jgi:hypothetical protein